MNNTPNNPPTRSRTKMALIGGVLAATLALGGVAIARPGGFGPGGPGFGPGAMIMRMVNRLDLTEQQEVKAIRIRRNLQQQAKESRQEMKGTLAKVADELEKPNPDARKLHNVADEVLQRISKLTHSAVDQLVELHSTFTPEQRTKLADELRQAAEHVGQGPDREGHGPRHMGK